MPAGAMTPLEVLDVHEEALVEAAALLDGRPAHEQRGAYRPVDRTLAVMRPRLVEKVLLGPPAAQPDGAGRGDRHGRERMGRVLEAAVRSFQPWRYRRRSG